MRKRQFIALADKLRFERDRYVMMHGQAAFDAMVDLAVSFCIAQNGRFKADVFRGYIAGTCGPCGGSIKK